MFYKVKVLNGVNLIITIIAILVSSLFFSETILAKKIETLDNKPVYRGIVEWDKYVTDLEGIEEDSNLIIKGIIQDNKENLLISDTHGYTYTKVLVTKVLNGDNNLLNKTIIFSEPYFETIIKDTPAYMINDNYSPAAVDQEYILFLKEYTGDNDLYKGIYILCYDEKGKYPVNNSINKARTNTNDFVDSLTNEELNIGPKDSTVYRNIYKSVLDKYILNSDIKTTELISEEEQHTEESTISNGFQISNKTIITKTADDIGAINKNNRLLVPLRNITELIGCTVEWDGSTKTAYVNKAGNIVKFIINSNEYFINDNIYELDVPAEIYDNRTYIPLRAVSESLGISIEYNNNNKTIILSY